MAMTSATIPLLFCIRCGSYSARRARGLGAECPRAPTLAGRQAIDRIQRGLQPWLSRGRRHRLAGAAQPPTLAAAHGRRRSAIPADESDADFRDPFGTSVLAGADSLLPTNAQSGGDSMTLLATPCRHASDEHPTLDEMICEDFPGMDIHLFDHAEDEFFERGRDLDEPAACGGGAVARYTVGGSSSSTDAHGSSTVRQVNAHPPRKRCRTDTSHHVMVPSIDTDMPHADE